MCSNERWSIVQCLDDLFAEQGTVNVDRDLCRLRVTRVTWDWGVTRASWIDSDIGGYR
jgi:hypothetical protein